MSNFFKKLKAGFNHRFTCDRRVEGKIKYTSHYGGKLVWRKKQGRALSIHYTNRDGGATERLISLKAVVQEYPDFVYFIAFCFNSGDVRMFRTDRITAISENGNTLDKKEFLSQIGIKRILKAYL